MLCCIIALCENKTIVFSYSLVAARKNGEGSRDQDSEGTVATREQGKNV